MIMKSAFIAILLFGSLAAVMAASGNGEIIRILMKCKTDENVELKDLEDMKNTHGINTDGSKRLIRCLFTEVGVMKDGKFDKEGSLQMCDKYHEGEADKENQIALEKEMTNACAEKLTVEASPDETAKLIFDCFILEAEKRGIDPMTKLS